MASELFDEWNDFDWRGRVLINDWTEGFTTHYGKTEQESFTIHVGVTCNTCGELLDDEGERTVRVTGTPTGVNTVETWHPKHAPTDLFGGS